MKHSMPEDDFHSAWDAWNQLGFNLRAERLKMLSHSLTGLREPEVQMLLKRIFDQAHTLSHVHDLPGPTGESNQLYLMGRGRVLVTGDACATPRAMVGQLIAALLCGNSVVLQWPEHNDWCHHLVEKAHQFGIPSGVLLAQSVKAKAANLNLEPLSAVALAGTDQTAREINAILAERSGVIVQLIWESHPEECFNLLQPDYLLRFITERTRTINTTAVGGNATLLELGNADH